MNVLYFLTPKNQVANIYDDSNLRQLIEKIDYHKYTAIPIINHDGQYIGTVAEGDILRIIKNQYKMDFERAQNVLVKDIPRRVDIKPVNANATMNDIVERAMMQNFVPVIDDNNVFIGIVTRKDVIKYFYDKVVKTEDENK
ncbi:MAG: CBS domain-containing protein [Clostridia bacterium]|nr:CBS domain-containing protein [Clostridia bacterium]